MFSDFASWARIFYRKDEKKPRAYLIFTDLFRNISKDDQGNIEGNIKGGGAIDATSSLSLNSSSNAYNSQGFKLSEAGTSDVNDVSIELTLS